MDNPDNHLQAYTPPTRMTFKRSDIAQMSPTEYRKNREAIIEAAKAGNITDDMRQPLGAAPVAIFDNGQHEALDIEPMPDTMGAL